MILVRLDLEPSCGNPPSLNTGLLCSRKSSLFGVGFGFDTEVGNTIWDQRYSVILEPRVIFHTLEETEEVLSKSLLPNGFSLDTQGLGHVQKNDQIQAASENYNCMGAAELWI